MAKPLPPSDPFDLDTLADAPTLAKVLADAPQPASSSLGLPPTPPASPTGTIHLYPWMSALQVYDKGYNIGAYKNNYNNALTALTLAPEWQGVFGLNTFDGNIYVRRKNGLMFIDPNTRLSDMHLSTVLQWFDRVNMEMNVEKLRMAIVAVANLEENKFNPVKEYLESLPPWDGVPVLETWLEYMFGAQGDPQYLSAIGQCWMRCAVARIYEPGCKADNMLIIEGEQGIGKSRAMRALAGDWFTDQLSNDLSSVAASHALQGKWIVELSELTSVRKSEIEDIKAFVSRQTDYYRKPYARYLEEIPRQCVLVGTTNITNWLKDETGGRRFWPFYATNIKIDLIVEQRDQLWAEALYQYKNGFPLCLDKEVTKLATSEQVKRLEDDEWAEIIEQYLADKDTVTTRELTSEVLAIPVGAVSMQQNKRLASVMTRLGWQRTQYWKNGVNLRGYKKKDS
jgi:putative DNA primase/helicase